MSRFNYLSSPATREAADEEQRRSRIDFYERDLYGLQKHNVPDELFELRRRLEEATERHHQQIREDTRRHAAEVARLEEQHQGALQAAADTAKEREDKLQAEVKAGEARLQDANGHADALAEELKAVRAMNLDHTRTLDSQRHRIASLQQAIDDAREELRRACNQLNDADRRAEEDRNQIQQLMDQLEQLAEAKADVEEALANMTRQRDQLARQAPVDAAQIQRLQQDLNAAHDEAERRHNLHREELEAKQSEIDRLSSALSQESAKLSRALVEKQHVADDLRDANARIQQLDKELKASVDQFQLAQSENVKSASRIAELTTRTHELERNLAASPLPATPNPQSASDPDSASVRQALRQVQATLAAFDSGAELPDPAELAIRDLAVYERNVPKLLQAIGRYEAQIAKYEAMLHDVQETLDSAPRLPPAQAFAAALETLAIPNNIVVDDDQAARRLQMAKAVLDAFPL